MTPTFVDNLNYSILALFEVKDPVYTNLKTLATVSHSVAHKQKIYDLLLTPEHQDLVRFVSSIPVSDFPPLLSNIFTDFKAQKNLLAFNILDLRDNIQNNLINTVNMFDMLEEFMQNVAKKRSKPTLTTLLIEDIQKYGYILGLLIEMRALYQNHNTLLEKINKALLGIDGYLKNFDGSLDAMSFYYEQHFINGISDLDLTDVSQTYGLKNKVEAVNPENVKPAQVCDKLLLNNFYIEDGLSLAKDVYSYDKLEYCPSIKKTCCSSSLINKLFENYLPNNFSVLQRKYQLVEVLLDNILSNYQSYNIHAYKLLGNPSLSPECTQKLRKLVFTPVNKQFFKNFKSEMRNANSFSKKSKANLFCFFCDYEFHKNAIESARISLHPSFCRSMVSHMFEFSRTYNLALIEYINTVVDAVQCNSETGEYVEEFSSRIGLNLELNQILSECNPKHPLTTCQDFCKQFSFEALNSSLDLDEQTIYEIHEFVLGKMETAGFKLNGYLDRNLSSVAMVDYKLQNLNNLGRRSLNNLELVLDKKIGLVDPSVQGGAIVKEYIKEENELLD